MGGWRSWERTTTCWPRVGATRRCSGCKLSASMVDRRQRGTVVGEEVKPRGWQWLRASGVLLRLGLRADPGLVLTFFGVVAVWQVLTLGRIYAMKLIVDAAIAQDLRSVTIVAAAYAVASVFHLQCGRTHLSVY